ncbi:hypothetical protein GCM10020367_72790 [Streptomyces sannanensis]|uniref:Uncharacterized protein n=1 Tax=Streptomyces sannanensis TaxID=285536 RepID=A0ABP6SPT9_9ACTN
MIATGGIAGSASHPVLTTPSDIDADQMRAFSEEEHGMFDGEVQKDGRLLIALTAWNSDIAGDWGTLYAPAKKGLAAGLASYTLSPGASAKPVVDVVTTAMGKVVSRLDKEHLLGTLTEEIPIRDLQDGDSRLWRLKQRDDWGSSWDYMVIYSVHLLES